jgi:hypothetical protein
MKNLLFLNCLLFASILVIQSCSDDDGPSSNITLDGSSFKVSSVTLLGISQDNEGHAALTFASVDGNNSKILTVDFEYDGVTTVTGTYSYPQTGSNRFLDDWLTNYTEVTGTTEVTSTVLDTGTVTVTAHGNATYTVVIDLKMVDGQVFKGTYKGKVEESFFNG